MIKDLLIVDDEPHLVKSYKTLFEARGVFVQTALSGAEAIRCFRQHPARIVLSDMQMDEMDGISLMNALKEMDPFVQIVFLTGYASVENAADALRQKDNAFDYIKKPVKNFNLLYETLEKAQNRYDELKNQTERKKENEKSFTVFRNIFDSMEAIVYVADIETYELIYTNKTFRDTFCPGDTKSPEGKKCWQVIQKEQTGPCPFCTNKRIVKEDKSPGEPFEWEFCNTRNHRWYSIVDKAIEWYDKRIVRLETAFDITEKKEHEQIYREFEKAIETSRKIESIGTLAGGVAHDFNNTLSAIIGNINLAQLGPLDNETQKFLQNAEEGVMQAKLISSKLTTFAKCGEPQKTRTDIVSLIKNELETKLRKKSIHYTFGSDPIPGPFFADQEQLKTAIGNIIQNSLDSISATGQIDVSIRYMQEVKNPARICISISDNGTGISRDHLDMIFNPYFTTKPLDSKKSTGLGLSIAWSIISRHGGNIHVDSEKGLGTTVHIFLPVFRMDLHEPRPQEKEGLKTGKTHSPGNLKRVLVVDDDEMTLDVVSRLLKRLDYEVTTSSSGLQALEICKSAKAEAKPLDFALLDYDMTGGISGFQILESLKIIDPGVIGVLMTGHSDHNEVKTYRDQGFSGLLEKPFSIRQLKTMMERLES